MLNQTFLKGELIWLKAVLDK